MEVIYVLAWKWAPQLSDTRTSTYRLNLFSSVVVVDVAAHNSQDKDGGTGGILMNVRETSAEKWLGDDGKMVELIGKAIGWKVYFSIWKN